MRKVRGQRGGAHRLFQPEVLKPARRGERLGEARAPPAPRPLRSAFSRSAQPSQPRGSPWFPLSKAAKARPSSSGAETSPWTGVVGGRGVGRLRPNLGMAPPGPPPQPAGREGDALKDSSRGVK